MRAPTIVRRSVSNTAHCGSLIDYYVQERLRDRRILTYFHSDPVWLPPARVRAPHTTDTHLGRRCASQLTPMEFNLVISDSVSA
jgi:hypothetical protein